MGLKNRVSMDRFRDARGLLDGTLRQIGYGLGSVFFIPNPWIGLVLWGALFSNPRFGAFALLGLAVGAGCKAMLRLGDGPSLGGGIKANALLVAVASAWLTMGMQLPLWGQVLIATVSAAMASVVTAALMAILDKSRFPVMVAGYCVIASCIFVLCPLCTTAAAGLMVPWVQPGGVVEWGEAFLRSMGALVYSPSLPFGILVCLAMFLWSRTALLTGIAAWISGVVTALLLQSMGFGFYFLPLSYNFFMSGVALGAVLFLPSRATLVMAVFGGAFCAVVALVLQVVSGWGSISYLPISSILTVWAGIGAVMLAGEQAIARRYTSSRFPPEVAWCRQAYVEKRFGHPYPLLAVPVAGALQVTQGFSGGGSHRGAWRHALDFQYAVPEGVGFLLAEQNIWSAIVISPAAGVVECVIGNVPDNPLGGSNFGDNWGNYVVLRLAEGCWLLLAHLKQGSISVKVGDRVDTGTVLGRVGNSGRSPVPHLHIQLQASMLPREGTRPFKLANYLSAPTIEGPWLNWHASGIPGTGDVLMAAERNPDVYDLLATMMPGSAVWFCEVSGDVSSGNAGLHGERTTRIQISLDDLGRYQFDSGKGGRLIAGLEPDAWRVNELERVQSPLLAFLGMAVPCVPFALQVGMFWDEVPPLVVSGMGFEYSLSPFFGSSFPVGQYVCEAVPQSSGGFIIRAIFSKRRRDVPHRLTCRFDRLRGPTHLKVEFLAGVLEYNLLSFEPGLPVQ